MTLLDPSKITRPEVRALLAWLRKLSDEAAVLFFRDPENREIDFAELWPRVMATNQRWFEGSRDHGTLTQKEQVFLARMHRFHVEYRADAFEEKEPQETMPLEQVDAGGVPAAWHTAPGVGRDRVLLYFHGGGFILGSPNSVRHLTAALGRRIALRVLSVDYRLAPEHPYPAAVDDCLATYRWLLESGIEAKNIALAGESAGGYLVLTTLLRARAEGLPLPIAGICLAPATDLAITGESYIKNASTDPVLADTGVFWWGEAFLGDADPCSPEVSPYYADLVGLPPLLIQASTSEMLFDDSRCFVERARNAGVDVTFKTWDETLHSFQYFVDLPEREEALLEIRRFLQRFL
jgi:acetyl esterase/lipase